MTKGNGLNKDIGTKKAKQGNIPWLLILIAVFIMLVSVMSVLYLKAVTVNSFCRESDYESAGYVNNELACFRLNGDENAEYRYMACQEMILTSNCHFTSQEYAMPLKPMEQNIKVDIE